MTRSAILRRAAFAIVALFGFQGSAFADGIPLGECHQPGGPLSGRVTLVNDLDCSDSVSEDIVIDHGTLDLNGHTIITSGWNVVCSGNCKVVGPGTIMGAGSGIMGSESLELKDVAITISGGIGVAAAKKLKLDHVSISGAAFGALFGTSAKIVDSTITATIVGVTTEGPGAQGGGPCTKDSMILRRSSVTGTSGAPCVGSDPPANCADIITCRKPKLSQSTCGTSCQGNGGVPCQPWGVCTGD